MRDRRKAKLASARLSSTGYLRLSSDLVPRDAKSRDLRFVVTPYPAEKKLELRMVNNGTSSYMARRKALYANSVSNCPIVTVKAALRFMAIRLPKKSKEFPVEKRNDVLIVRF